MRPALLALVVLAGCSKPHPDAADLAACKTAVKDALVDPDSAKFETGYRRYEFPRGHAYLMTVNSKNRMGGYAGKQQVDCTFLTEEPGPPQLTWR